MKSYYRFYIHSKVAEEILEYDTGMVSFETANSKAEAWAKQQEVPCEYKGIFEHDF